jgi:hypothetical protein
VRDSQPAGVAAACLFVHRISVCTLEFDRRRIGEMSGNNCNNSTTYTKMRCFNKIAGNPFGAAEIEKAR